uniref:chitinase n=1 Tax=Holotrichia oblita TaxID=644536 RepID=I6LM40_HOLOL|nr:chitinase [Holotrichia oblita]
MWKSFVLLTILSALAVDATDKVVCYHGSWSHYRPGDGKYSVTDIDPFLCTHIIYGFVGINWDGSIRIMDSWLEIDLAALANFNGLKARNPSLKTLVAIGGWNEGSTTFSAVASSASLRTAFVNNAASFLQKHGFDGFDLDWEYPAQRGGAATDKNNFSLMLAEFRTLFDQRGYLITAAVAAAGGSVDLSYDVPKLNQYLHFINVMTYDLHGTWDAAIGHNAPLYPSAVDVTVAQKQLTVDACIRGWISRGASPSKLILGVGTYGRGFTVANACSNKLGASHSGGCTAGPYTREAGILGYNEICEKLLAGGWTVTWDNLQQVPYMCNGNQWIGYDNPESIAIKTNYAKSMGLGGVMVWSLETDDFKGKCGQVNPLLNTIRTTLSLPITDGGSSGGSTGGDTGGSTGGNTEGSSDTTTTTTTTPAPVVVPPGSICTKEGYVRDATNCGIFYRCVLSGGSYIQHSLVCPFGLYFDTTVDVCNYPSLVAC